MALKSSKKEILKFSIKIWEICGVYSSEKTSFAHKIVSIFVNIWMFCSLGSMLLFSIIFLHFEFANGDTKTSVYVMLQMVATTIIYPHISNVRQRRKLAEVVKIIQKNVNERLERQTEGLYVQAERKSYLVSKWIPIFYLVSYDGLFMAMTGIFLLHDLVIGEIDVTKWFNIHTLW